MRGRSSKGLARFIVVVALASAALIAPASAGATTTCFYAGGTMTVGMDDDGDTAFINRLVGAGAEIRVNGNSCVNVATVDNTDTIEINDSVADDFVAVTLELANGGFAPGDEDELTSADEIEIRIDFDDDGDDGGFDTLNVIDGEPGASDVIRAGEDGFNLNAGAEALAVAPDEDLTNLAGNDFPDVAGFLTLDGGPGNDELRATGDLGTGAPLASKGLLLTGGSGSDELTGGTAGDRLEGGIGDDELDGGGSTNALFHDGAPGPVTVDLGNTGPQNTGAVGTDTISNIANLRGGPFGDLLTGDAGVNGISGAAGADTVRGGLGDDSLSATDDPSDPPEGDTLDYDVAGAPAGVSVDLNGTGAVSGGQGSDTIGTMMFGNKFVNVIGGPLADTIVGDQRSQTLAGGAGADSITGGLGSDTLLGDAGFDSLLAADGLSDTVSCGPDLASFSIDAALDTVAADCTPPPPAATAPPATTKKCKRKKKKKGKSAAAAKKKRKGCKKKKRKR